MTNQQKIENLLDCIHGLQAQLDEKAEVIRRQDDIISRLERLTEEQRELIERQECFISARRTAPATIAEGGCTRRTWQTRRRNP